MKEATTTVRRADARRGGRLQGPPELPPAGYSARMEGGPSFPFGGDPEDLHAQPARVRRAAGRVRAGGPCEQFATLTLEHRRRADGCRAPADPCGGQRGRAVDRASRLHARALSRGRGACFRGAPRLHARELIEDDQGRLADSLVADLLVDLVRRRVREVGVEEAEPALVEQTLRELGDQCARVTAAPVSGGV